MNYLRNIPLRIALVASLLCLTSCGSMLGDMGGEIASLQRQVMAMLIGKPLPTISLEYESASVPVGTLIDMGSRLADDYNPDPAAKEIILTVRNTGITDVVIEGINLTGKYSYPFTLLDAASDIDIPDTITIPVNGTFSFRVSFRTNDIGFMAAIMSIDTGEDFALFSVTIACDSTNEARGLMRLYRFMDEIADGGNFNMAPSTSCTFTLKNIGTADITDIEVTMDNTAVFNLVQPPPERISCIVGENEANFRVCYLPPDLEPHSTTVTISFLDGMENKTFTMTLNAAVDELPIPDIKIRDGSSTASILYNNGDTYTFHWQYPDNFSAEEDFYIHNEGGAGGTLYITSVAFTGDAAYPDNNFTLCGPFAATVSPDNYTYFTVRYNPKTLADHSATLTVNYLDGGTEKSYVIYLRGTSIVPLINVTQNSSPVANDGAAIDFGSCYALSRDGSPSTSERTVTLTNTGNAPLTISGIDLNGDTGGHYNIVSGPALPVTLGTLPANNNTSFIVRFDPASFSASPVSAHVDITSNDADGRTPYIVNLTGSTYEPRMNITVEVVSMSTGSIVSDEGSSLELDWKITAATHGKATEEGPTTIAEETSILGYKLVGENEEFSDDMSSVSFTGIPKNDGNGVILAVTMRDYDFPDWEYLANVLSLSIGYDSYANQLLYSDADGSDEEKPVVSFTDATQTSWAIDLDGAAHDYYYYTYGSEAGEVFIKFSITAQDYLY